MKITKKIHGIIFITGITLLAVTKLIFPDIVTTAKSNNKINKKGTIYKRKKKKKTRFFNADGTLIKNKIQGVPKYTDAFPDLNDIQLASAQRLGVKPVIDRNEAELRKSELVYIGSNPYYHVDRLQSSIPYLVPQAATLLQEIGKNFFDSLQIKGIPLHKVIVTSVLRTKDDIQKLRNYNRNASENSCHQYGTTFDIAYNRYKTVSSPDTKPRRAIRNDTLKWIISEVLNDLRQDNKCYIKYEVKQGCFHITAR